MGSTVVVFTPARRAGDMALERLEDIVDTARDARDLAASTRDLAVVATAAARVTALWPTFDRILTEWATARADHPARLDAHRARYGTMLAQLEADIRLLRTALEADWLAESKTVRNLRST
jgi:hypothetical protein